MTAANLFLDDNEIHAFTDGGHYGEISGKLHHYGSKVFYLPQYDAILIFSGPSYVGHFILRALENASVKHLLQLLDVLPNIVTILKRKDLRGVRFSVVLVGIYEDKTVGLTLEETNNRHQLNGGMQVKSLSTPYNFDPQDIEYSGLLMMEDQRSHGVVFGWCQHTVLGRNAFVSRILERWNDIPTYFQNEGRTLGAKIQDLTVDRIRFADNAVNSIAQGSTSSGAVPNSGGFPIMVTAQATGTYTSNQASSNAQFTVTLTRVRDSKVLASREEGFTGNTLVTGTQVKTINVAALDDDATTSETYNMSVNVVGNFGGTIAISNQSVKAIYTKK